jgi:hypothetical protein
MPSINSALHAVEELIASKMEEVAGHQTRGP